MLISLTDPMWSIYQIHAVLTCIRGVPSVIYPLALLMTLTSPLNLFSPPSKATPTRPRRKFQLVSPAGSGKSNGASAFAPHSSDHVVHFCPLLSFDSPQRREREK